MSLLERVSVEVEANDLKSKIIEGAIIVSREDVPGIDVYVSTDADEKIVYCTANICPVLEVNAEKRAEFFEKLLAICPTLPLSSVGISGGNVILYGQLIGDSISNVITEVDFLFDNIVEIVPVIKEYI